MSFSPVVSAADDTTAEEKKSMTFNPQIFSLSKKKENAFDAASATYVLGSEDIRRSGATSIPEALRLVPGVQVARMSGNTWAISIRGFDRQFSNKLLVMIDGRTVYTQLFSGVAWDIHDYVMEDIDRIEVIRGPGGTIWGSNAVNGIINIITKSAVRTQGVYVSQIVGDQDKSITEARYGGSLNNNKDDYRLYVKKAVRDGLDNYTTKGSNHDGNSQDRAGFRYDISSIKDSSISIHGDIFSGTASNYFTTLNNPNKNDKDSRGGNIVVNWDKKLSKQSSFILNSYYDYDQFSIPVLQRSSQTFDVDFQHFYNSSKDNQFIWGLGYRQIADDIEESTTLNGAVPINYSPDHRNDQWFTAFIQEKFGLIPDKLYLTIGSKFEKNEFTGFEYQPNARLAYYPSRNQTVWASVSRAIRTPTRAESDITLKSTNSNTTVNQGSSTYGIEQLIAYEVGYRIKPTTKTLIDATAFYNQYSKLRTFEAVTNTTPSTPTAANLGYGESQGFEISGKWQVTNDWRMEASYDYLNLDLHISDNSTDSSTSIIGAADGLQVAEGMSPKNQIKLRSFYNISPKVEFDNILYYVDNLPTAGATFRTTGIPSYFRFDTRLGYLPSRNLDLSVGIQNLLNQGHREFKAALYNNQTEIGRTFYVKAVWQY
ncbi:MAG: TonB-dependent receptor [Pseudomonadota bacterium]